MTCSDWVRLCGNISNTVKRILRFHHSTISAGHFPQGRPSHWPWCQTVWSLWEKQKSQGILGYGGAQSEPTEVKYVMIDELALIVLVWPPLSIKEWIMHAFPLCVGTTDDLDYSDEFGKRELRADCFSVASQLHYE